MRIIEEYLFYIQEAPDESRTKEKKEQFKELNKQYKSKLAKCKQQVEPSKTNCINSLKPTQDKLNQLSGGAGDAVEKIASAVTGFVNKHETLVTYAVGAAAVSLAVAASIKIYNRFYSQAAKSCTDAKNKTECMTKFKIQAMQRAKAEITRGKAKCSQTKNPEKCIEKMKKQLQNYDDKIASLKS